MCRCRGSLALSGCQYAEKKRNSWTPWRRHFVCIRQCAESVHAGNAAVHVFPYQLLAIHVTSHNHGPPAEDLEVEHAVVPIHSGAGTAAILIISDDKQHAAFGVVRCEARRTVGPGVVNETARGEAALSQFTRIG